jgi:hypothetical protein
LSSIERECPNFNDDTSANEKPLKVVKDSPHNTSLVTNSPAHLPVNAQSLVVRSSTDINSPLFSLASGPPDASGDHIFLEQDYQLLHGINSTPQLTSEVSNETSLDATSGDPVPEHISEGFIEVLPSPSDGGLNEASPSDALPIVRSLSQLASKDLNGALGSTSSNAMASLTILPSPDLGNNCLALSQSVLVTPCCSGLSSIPTDGLVDKILTVTSGSDFLGGPVNHPAGMEIDSGSSVPHTTVDLVERDTPHALDSSDQPVSGPENS